MNDTNKGPISISSSYSIRMDTPSFDVDRTFEETQAFIGQGRLAEAEPLARKITDAQPDHARAWHVRGFLELSRGQLDDALSFLERVSALAVTIL